MDLPLHRPSEPAAATPDPGSTGRSIAFPSEASGMITGSLRFATHPGSVSACPREIASSGGDAMPTKVPEAATSRKPAVDGIVAVHPHRVAVDQAARPRPRWPRRWRRRRGAGPAEGSARGWPSAGWPATAPRRRAGSSASRSPAGRRNRWPARGPERSRGAAGGESRPAGRASRPGRGTALRPGRRSPPSRRPIGSPRRSGSTGRRAGSPRAGCPASAA